jgi:hypothetical protein
VVTLATYVASSGPRFACGLDNGRVMIWDGEFYGLISERQAHQGAVRPPGLVPMAVPPDLNAMRL